MRSLTLHLSRLALALGCTIVCALFFVAVGPRGPSGVALSREASLDHRITSHIFCSGRVWFGGMGVLWTRHGAPLTVGNPRYFGNHVYQDQFQAVQAGAAAWSLENSLSRQFANPAASSIEATFGLPFRWLYLAVDVGQPNSVVRNWYSYWQDALIDRPVLAARSLRVLWQAFFASWAIWFAICEAAAAAGTWWNRQAAANGRVTITWTNAARSVLLLLFFGLVPQLITGAALWLWGPIYNQTLAAEKEIMHRAPHMGVPTANMRVFAWFGGYAVHWTRRGFASPRQPLAPLPPIFQELEISERKFLLTRYPGWGGTQSIALLGQHHTLQSIECLFGWPVSWLYHAIPDLKTPPEHPRSMPIAPNAQWRHTQQSHPQGWHSHIWFEPWRFALGWLLWSDMLGFGLIIFRAWNWRRCAIT